MSWVHKEEPDINGHHYGATDLAPLKHKHGKKEMV